MIVCEDASQLTKIDAVRDRLPALRQIVVIDGPPEAARQRSRSMRFAARGRFRERAELDVAGGRRARR